MATGDVFRLLRRHWLFIVVLALVGAASGLVWAAFRTPEYTAKAELFVTVTTGQSTGELAQSSNFSQQQARNFAALATREIVLGPVIEDLHLSLTVGELRKRVSASVPLNTSLISLQASASRPQLAADIANAAARELATTVAGMSPKVDDVRGTPIKAQLIETAIAPALPASPNISLLALFGLLAGLVVAVTVQVVSELAVSRIRSAEQLESTVSLPVLGSLDRDRTAAVDTVAVVAQPMSMRAEQVRQIRTALKYLPGGEHRVFVLTSAISGEGKSTMGANIAAAFAADGVSTVLVDADLRRPVQADLLELRDEVGLSDVIAGERSLDDALQEWGPDGLSVLTAGRIPPNPSELLGSEDGQRVLIDLQSRFEVMIIDTPPLTAVTDATVVGRHFGGIVLVVGSQRVRISEVRRALAALKSADVAIRGAILNLVKPEASLTAYAYEASAKPGGLPRRRAGGRGSGRPTLGPSGLRKTTAKAFVAVALAVLVALGWLALTQRSASLGQDAAAALASSAIHEMGGTSS